MCVGRGVDIGRACVVAVVAVVVAVVAVVGYVARS